MKVSKSGFTRAKVGMVFGIFSSLIAIFLCFVFLVDHLLEIQIPERLRYIKDYTDFVLTIEEIPDCTNQLVSLFQYENEIYNGLCVKQVYVNYGKVKAPLSMVLEKEYITFADIRKKLSNLDKEAEEVFHYEYRRSEQAEGNYRVTVSTKDYQKAKITEITFEPFSIVEKDQKSVQFSGELTIN